LDAAGEISWLQEEDNGLLTTLIEKFAPSSGKALTEPVVWWTEDSRLDIHTTLSALSTASDTSLDLTDSRIATVNTFLLSPADGEVMKVTAIDHSTKVATVTRGYNGTAKVAKASGDKIIAFPSFMGELSDPQLGHGRLPGDPVWNCISIVSETFRVSKLQQNSVVTNNWGKVEKAVIDTMLNMRRQVGKALLFNQRGTQTTTNDGQEYISAGVYHYIKDGLLDLGLRNSNLTWPVLNDWLEQRFDEDASSQTKELLCGLWLFKAIQRMVRDTKMQAVEPYFEPSLGTRVYPITTDGGYTVNCMLDRYGLGTNEGLGDWGFLLDMAHIEGAHYNGLDFQWIQNIQDNKSVMYREDAYIGSFSLILKHQETMGIIRGAGQPIITR